MAFGRTQPTGNKVTLFTVLSTLTLAEVMNLITFARNNVNNVISSISELLSFTNYKYASKNFNRNEYRKRSIDANLILDKNENVDIQKVKNLITSRNADIYKVTAGKEILYILPLCHGQRDYSFYLYSPNTKEVKQEEIKQV